VRPKASENIFPIESGTLYTAVQRAHATTLLSYERLNLVQQRGDLCLLLRDLICTALLR